MLSNTNCSCILLNDCFIVLALTSPIPSTSSNSSIVYSFDVVRVLNANFTVEKIALNKTARKTKQYKVNQSKWLTNLRRDFEYECA